jgi:hypothetical protein
MRLGALAITRVQNQKPSNFSRPSPDPFPLFEEGKVFWFWFGVSVFYKAPFKFHLLENFLFAFFRLHANPRRFARSSVSTNLTIAHKPAATSHRHTRLHSRSLLGGGGRSLFLGRAL